MFMTSVMGLHANHLAAQNSTPEYTEWYVGLSAGASIIESEEKIPNILGLYGAYFFNQKYGAGLVARKCNYYITETLLGVYASAGIAIRPSKLMSFGINAEWSSSFEDISDSEGLLGINIGISFHF